MDRAEAVPAGKENVFSGSVVDITFPVFIIPRYDVERTICDFLRTRNRCDEETVISVIKNYAASDKKDLNRLFTYSEMFKVGGELIKYMEVLL